MNDKVTQVRIQRAEWAMAQRIPGHEITIVGRALSEWLAHPERGGNSKAACQCGWVASRFTYGEQPSWAIASYHLRKILKGATP